MLARTWNKQNSYIGWGECKLVQTPCKTAWYRLLKLNTGIPYSPAISLLATYQQTSGYMFTKNVHVY